MKDTVMKILKYILLIAVTVLFLFPVIYMLACSFMTGSQVSEMLNFSDGKYKELNMIPNMATLEQFYQTLFRKPEYLLKFWNSVICTFPTVIGQVAVSSLAAFAFAKLKFPFRDKLFFIYIILLILPLQVTLVPDYMILENMNLLNNFLAVILPGTFSAFGICLLRQSRTHPLSSLSRKKPSHSRLLSASRSAHGYRPLIYTLKSRCPNGIPLTSPPTKCRRQAKKNASVGIWKQSVC